MGILSTIVASTAGGVFAVTEPKEAQNHANYRRRKVVEYAVWRTPVSPSNSLIYGKIQGNSADYAMCWMEIEVITQ